MKIQGSKLDMWVRNMEFIGIQSATFGFLLLEACLMQLKVKIVAHAISMVITVAVVAIIYRRTGEYGLKPAIYVALADPERGKKLFNPSGLAAALFLISIGYLAAVSARSQSAIGPVLYAIFIFLFPWTKIALCRKNLLVSWLMMNAGAAAGLLQGPLPHPIFLGISTWIFWMVAIAAWFGLIFLGWEKSLVSRAHDRKKLKDAPDVMHY